MVLFQDCPHCGNSSTSTSIVDVEIGGISLKGIQCNNCKKILVCFKDFDSDIKELKESLNDLESRVDDLES